MSLLSDLRFSNTRFFLCSWHCFLLSDFSCRNFFLARCSKLFENFLFESLGGFYLEIQWVQASVCFYPIWERGKMTFQKNKNGWFHHDNSQCKQIRYRT